MWRSDEHEQRAGDAVERGVGTDGDDGQAATTRQRGRRGRGGEGEGGGA